MKKKFRTALVGFEFYPELVSALRASEDLDIVAHITHETSAETINVNDVYFGHQDYRLTYEMPVDLYEDFLQKYFLRSLANFGRVDIYTGGHTDYAKSIYLFKKITTYLYDLIFSRDINLILIGHMPHECLDTLFESLGNFLHIPVRLLVTPSYTDKAFFCLNHHSEYGFFKNRRQVRHCGPVSVDTFVIDSTAQSKTNAWYRFVTNEHNKKTKALLTSSPCTGFYNGCLYRQRIHDMHSMPRQESLSGKYVYFPLHVQPEASTMGQAPSIFDDQTLCIEQIAKIIPQEYAILVKEHPSQTFYYRDTIFYDRLRALPQVRMVPDHMDSHTLIRNSAFVATVTGTAGWEALKYERPVVYFGYATYREMPGAFRFSPEIDIEAVLRYRVSRKEVEDSLGRMFATMYEGGIGEKIPPDREKNRELFLLALADILGRLREETDDAISKAAFEDLRRRSRCPEAARLAWLVPAAPLEHMAVYPMWRRCGLKALYLVEKILLKLQARLLRL